MTGTGGGSREQTPVPPEASRHNTSDGDLFIGDTGDSPRNMTPTPPRSSRESSGSPYLSVVSPGIPQATSRFSQVRPTAELDDVVPLDLPLIKAQGRRNIIIQMKGQIAPGATFRDTMNDSLEEPTRTYTDGSAQELIIREFQQFMRDARMPAPEQKPVLVAPRVPGNSLSYTYVTVIPSGLVSGAAWNNIAMALHRRRQPTPCDKSTYNNLTSLARDNAT
uniref:Uncharacterized protein n=1 Tax=Bionectria ochroleuca TaxID=29856 RepID=A0A8H7N250_BIOOC